jgi:cell division protease FtsH
VEKVSREVVILPTNDSLNDLGLRNPEVQTQIKVKDNTSSQFWSGLLPTIIGFGLFFIIAMLILGKM